MVAFEKLTKSQKRVAIASDVLAQLEAKRVLATPGHYFRGAVKGKSKNDEVRDLLKKQKKCEVCALGAMFVCGVEKADKLKAGDVGYYEDGKNKADVCFERHDMTEYLGRFFDQDQLDMIEDAFEMSGDSWDFASEVDDPNERMRLIMENIVANKGLFKPARRPVATYVTPGFK